MDASLNITIFESLYLVFMFFVFRTSYSFSSIQQDSKTNLLGKMFIHNSGHNENKICLFGKIMAIIFINLIFVRYYFIKDKTIALVCSLVFYSISIPLAYIMNWNALIYIFPLLFTESFILYSH